jgi:carbonic anhydrase
MVSLAQGSLCCLSASALSTSFATLLAAKRQRSLEKKDKMLSLVKLLLFEKVEHQECSLAESKSAVAKAEVAQRSTDMEHNKEDNLTAIRGMQGFSMEDARKRNEELKAGFKDLTPSEVLTSLQRGNARFWTGNAVRPETSAFERRALIMQQFPLTAVLGCSDSRVPVEVVFDQKLGEMFVARVAGNCLGTATQASLQYAVHHLKVKVLLVMGHEGCGAVKAAQLPIQQINKEPEALSNTLKLIKLASMKQGCHISMMVGLMNESLLYSTSVIKLRLFAEIRPL